MRKEWIAPGIGLLAVAVPTWASPQPFRPIEKARDVAARATAATREGEAVLDGKGSPPSWETCRNDSAGYAIAFPAHPWKMGKKPNAPAVPGEERYAATVGQYVFRASSHALSHPVSGEQTQNLIAGAFRDEIVHGMHGKLVSDKSISRSGLTGSEFVVRHGEREQRCVILLSDQRSYQYAADGPAGQLNQPIVDRFIHSFRLASASVAPAHGGKSVLAVSAAGWTDYAPSGAGFSLKVPGLVTPSEQKAMEGGQEVTYHSFHASHASNDYQFGYAVYPADLIARVTPAPVLLNFRNGFLGALSAKPAAERTVREGGVDWREVTTAPAANSPAVVCRYGFSGTRLIFLRAAAPQDASAHAYAAKFFDSFHLDGIAPAGGGSAANANAWKKIAMKSGGVTVLMPGQALLRKASFRSGAGTVTLRGYTAELDGERYETGLLELPAGAEGDLEARINLASEAYARALEGRVTESHPCGTDSTGREFRAELKDGRSVLARVVPQGDRLVLASAITAPDHSSSVTPLRLLNSVRPSAK